MFTPRKLLAFLIKALLDDDPSLTDAKPYVVALVPITYPLTVLGVALDIPAIVLVSNDSFDSRVLLSHKLCAYESLERLRVRDAQFTRVLGHFGQCADTEKFEDPRVWILGENLTTEGFPWNVWVAGRLFVRP